jgi:hypothetical protein
MSKRRILLLTLPVVLLLAAVAGGVWFALPKKTAVTLDVFGTAGIELKGTAEVDGISQDLAGTVPTQFVLEGYRVTYSLTTPADSGEFRVRYLIGGAAFGSSGSQSPPRNGVRGWVKSSWGGSSPSGWIESFDREAQPAWLSPPP